MQAKHVYLLSLSDNDVGRAGLKVINITGKPIRVNVAGKNYIIDGIDLVTLPSGNHRMIADTQCGRLVRDLSMTAQKDLQVTISCDLKYESGDSRG